MRLEPNTTDVQSQEFNQQWRAYHESRAPYRQEVTSKLKDLLKSDGPQFVEKAFVDAMSDYYLEEYEQDNCLNRVCGVGPSHLAGAGSRDMPHEDGDGSLFVNDEGEPTTFVLHRQELTMSEMKEIQEWCDEYGLDMRTLSGGWIKPGQRFLVEVFRKGYVRG
jgi:hypothetical protein